jgi:uroporphyrin-III C-methyltransferase
MKGKVYIVGAGPGDVRLLTLRALTVLQQADVILHDDLVSEEILALAGPGQRLRNVGKRCGKAGTSQGEINSLLIRHATEGLNVVRLKGGDPLVFGRAGEEMDALRAGGIDFEVVPGVTAALAAGAAVKVSLTDRRWASQVIFVSGHSCAGHPRTDWRAVVSARTTIVIYMPGQNHGTLAAELREAGLSADTPAILVSRAATREERIYRTTVGDLPWAQRLSAPTVLLIGATLREAAESTPAPVHECVEQELSK